jgi:peptide/nickel transport system permease protein
MAVALVVGVALGILAARRAGGVLDQLLSSAAIAALSLPQFWLGALLIAWFAVQLKWLPTSGSVGAASIILPAITFALASIGRIAQNTRAAMIDELGTQHILVAQAKGLPGPYLIFRHALPNVAVPILTLFSYEFVYALAGYSVVVETVFAWPGIGFLSIQAIQRQDLLLVQGIVFVVAIIVVLVNIVTDLLYKLIDPRIEL